MRLVGKTERDKHSSLFSLSISDKGKKFYNTDTRNSEGSSRHRILLDVKSRPDSPTQLQVTWSQFYKTIAVIFNGKLRR